MRFPLVITALSNNANKIQISHESERIKSTQHGVFGVALVDFENSLTGSNFNERQYLDDKI